MNSKEEKIVEHYKIVETGTDRYASYKLAWKGPAGDFHSLEIVGNSTFRIDKEQFQQADSSGSWIGGVHSFDYENRLAIIQVARNKAIGERESKVIYTWEKWNFEEVTKLEELMVCESPFDRPNIYG